MNAYSETLIVPNETGLHLRVAAMAAQAASRFNADVRISKGELHVNARSVLGLLTLGAGQGSRLTVTGEGADACAAVRAIVSLFQSLCGENQGKLSIVFSNAE